MKNRILLAIIMTAALTAGYAAGPEMSGKWSTRPQAKVKSGLGSKILEAMTGNASSDGCRVPVYQQFPGPRGNCVMRPPLGQRFFETVLTADIKINAKNNNLTGSVKFHQPDRPAQDAIAPTLCTGFEIAEGTFAGNVFTFRTQSSVHGVKVWTNWKGAVLPDSSMTLEPQDPLPCADKPTTPTPAFGRFQLPGGFGGGFGGLPLAQPPAPPAPSTDPLIFRRADPAISGAPGRWVTREPGPAGVLELKAASGGAGVTGSFKNICQEERRLEGTFADRKLTLTRAANARNYGETTWLGEMLDDNTMRVTVEPPFRCAVETTRTFVLFRTN